MRKLLSALFFCGLLLAAPSAHADESLVQRMIGALQGQQTVVMPPPGSMEVAFSPHGGGTELVIKAIQSAKQSIHVAAYSFTSRPIAKALIEAHQLGVDVRIVLDQDQMSKDRNSAAASLVEAGIPARVDTVHTLQHDKYMVVDGVTVETGSFNYTAAAEQHNSENVLVLWDTPKLAEAYGRDWQSLWDRAASYSSR